MKLIIIVFLFSMATGLEISIEDNVLKAAVKIAEIQGHKREPTNALLLIDNFHSEKIQPATEKEEINLHN